MSAPTSSGGRCQLSEEKAKSVSVPIPRPRAASTVLLTASAPATCPAARGRPFEVAQRPLPSMMIATCKLLCLIKWMGTKKSRFARGVDDGFHVVQVALERLAAGVGEPVLGLG